MIPAKGLYSGRRQEDLDFEEGFERANGFSLAALELGLREELTMGLGDTCPQNGEAAPEDGGGMVVPDEVGHFIKVFPTTSSSTLGSPKAGHPGSVILKVCSTDLWGSPRPFQGTQEIKTMFVILLRHY